MIPPHPILQILNSTIRSFPSIKLAILFGSFAKQTANAQSDIDLAIAAARPIALDEFVEIQTQFSLKTGREVDLIDLNCATGAVFEQALTTGRVLINDDSTLHAQILKRLAFDNADFEPRRKKIMEERRKKAFS